MYILYRYFIRVYNIIILRVSNQHALNYCHRENKTLYNVGSVDLKLKKKHFSVYPSAEIKIPVNAAVVKLASGALRNVNFFVYIHVYSERACTVSILPAADYRCIYYIILLYNVLHAKLILL